MKKITTFTLLIISLFAVAQQQTIDQKVNTLLKKMTIEEKIGQLNQYTGDNSATGPITINPKQAGRDKSRIGRFDAQYHRNKIYPTISGIGDTIQPECIDLTEKNYICCK